MKILVFLLLSFVFCGNYSQGQLRHISDAHKYLTYQGWELVKSQYPYVINTEMNLRIGDWQDGNLNASGPWQKGKIVTGAYREDEEDVVWGYVWPYETSTHFWDVDYADDNRKFVATGGYEFENSYVKTKALWYGQKENGNGWLQVPDNSWYRCGLILWKFRLKYNNLANVYKYDSIWVTHFLQSGSEEWQELQQPILYKDLMSSCGYTNYYIKNQIKIYCWEIVGRICHLIGDAGVPAHAHNNEHWQETYEKEYMPVHYTDWDYEDARNQGFPQYSGGLINVNSKANPLRFLLYTTNQIADRFASNGCSFTPCPIKPGDYEYQHYYQDNTGSDNYTSMIQPFYDRIVVSVNPSQIDDPYCYEVAQNAYVYSIRSIGGFLWYVYNQFNIQVETPPNVGNISCNLPNPQNVYWNENAIFSVNATGSNLNYYWSIGKCGSFGPYCDYFMSDFPPGIALPQGINNSTFTISNNNYLTKNCNWPPQNPSCGNPSDNIWMKIKLEVYNNYGSQTRYFNYIKPIASFRPQPPPPPPGCPYIYVFNSESDSWIVDNNILHKSEFEEFKDQVIEDIYLLRIKPGTIDGKVSIYIRENDNNVNIFDQIKLFAVDHPIGTIVGITEENEIVLYAGSSVQSSDYADLNNSEITELIQYDYNGEKIILGNKDDSVFAHYEIQGQLNAIKYFNDKYNINSRRSSNLALIGNMSSNLDSDLDVDRKTIGGVLDFFINGKNFSKSFARRELNAPVIINLDNEGDVIDHIEIKWQRDFNLKYFSVTPIMYEGYTKIELPLAEATHSINDDIMNQLMYVDNYNASLDSSATINLWFNNINPPQSGMIRDYVFETNGRSIFNGEDSGPDNLVNNSNSSTSTSFDYKLFSNYPNPFNPVTNIKYQIAKEGITKIMIFNNLGQLVKVLVDEFKSPGSYEIYFDGSNFASGVYYYRIEVNNFFAINKMLLIK